MAIYNLDISNILNQLAIEEVQRLYKECSEEVRRIQFNNFLHRKRIPDLNTFLDRLRDKEIDRSVLFQILYTLDPNQQDLTSAYSNYINSISAHNKFFQSEARYNPSTIINLAVQSISLARYLSKPHTEDEEERSDFTQTHLLNCNAIALLTAEALSTHQLEERITKLAHVSNVLRQYLSHHFETTYQDLLDEESFRPQHEIILRDNMLFQIKAIGIEILRLARMSEIELTSLPRPSIEALRKTLEATKQIMLWEERSHQLPIQDPQLEERIRGTYESAAPPEALRKRLEALRDIISPNSPWNNIGYQTKFNTLYWRCIRNHLLPQKDILTILNVEIAKLNVELIRQDEEEESSH